MNIVGFSCINFELTSVKQKNSNKRGTVTKTYILLSAHFSPYFNLVWLHFYISSHSLVCVFHASINYHQKKIYTQHLLAQDNVG